MFDFIGSYDGRGVRGSRLEVEYDPALGYPLSIHLVADDQPPDFGLTIQARNLKRL